MKLSYTFMYIILILIILLFSYYNSLNYNVNEFVVNEFVVNEHVEGFTPSLRKIYRPYVRNTRIFTEGFYNKTKKHVINFFKKFEII